MKTNTKANMLAQEKLPNQHFLKLIVNASDVKTDFFSQLIIDLLKPVFDR